MSEPMRLDKRLVELLHCSRGEAERYIKAGWVMVDGEVVQRPNFKVTDQHVALHDDATLEEAPAVTLLLNCPEAFNPDEPSAALQWITPESHYAEDDSEIRMLNSHFSNLTPTAPLEAGATGLLVFTRDWQVTRRLVEDAKKNEQEYVVEVAEEITPEQIKQLNESMKQNHWPLPRARVSQQSEQRLRFALSYARPGQIEFMCRSVGLTIVSLRRIRIGRVSMSKLPAGQWRYLPAGEMF